MDVVRQLEWLFDLIGGAARTRGSPSWSHSSGTLLVSQYTMNEPPLGDTDVAARRLAQVVGLGVQLGVCRHGTARTSAEYLALSQSQSWRSQFDATRAPQYGVSRCCDGARAVALIITHVRPGNTAVRNTKAFQILQSYFLQSKNEQLRLRVLDCILGVYAANTLNFLLLQQLHTLAHFIEEFTSLSYELKDGVLRVLIFVVTVVNYVPFQELSSLGCLLQGSLLSCYSTPCLPCLYSHILHRYSLLSLSLSISISRVRQTIHLHQRWCSSSRPSPS